ncbi:MAG TPA: glutamate--tRNA ligase family protein [Candidatus Aminicenantes bacterium]|nr:glutamate--tRNA ligase family protein [Candidatus Aminicenantes bacterium]
MAVESDTLKDQVLIKSDGSPTYNFSCVVDDAHMGITHILRGDDHISNTPKQILFYEAFGLAPPRFGHMPLILGPDGSKLSKRHGGVSVEEYRREGFLPEALANYLILLGWMPRDGRELMTAAEAASRFEIAEMSGVQAKFDLQKLRWLNAWYIAMAPGERLVPDVRQRLEAAGTGTSAFPDDYVSRVVDLYRVRAKTVGEFPPMIDLFFREDFAFEDGGRALLDAPGNRDLLAALAGRLDTLPDFSRAAIEAAFRALAEERGLKAAAVVHPARMAVSGKSKGAGLFEMMEVLGRERAVARLRRAAHA